MKMFVHIPRTGGTSLLDIFRKWYGVKMLTVYDKDGSYDTDNYDIAYGHYYLANMDYILFLREPYEQQLSYYNYTAQHIRMPNIDDFFMREESKMLRFLPPLDRVVFCGIYERYEEDIKRLAEFLGKDYILPNKVNTSKHRVMPSSEAREAFIKNNEYIYELYNSYL